MSHSADFDPEEVKRAFPNEWAAVAGAVTAACQNAIADLLPTVVPVFRMVSARHNDFEGSSVLLCRGDRHYIFSAAHVFDACAHRPVFLNGSIGIPAGEPHVTNPPAGGTREDDTLDLGAIRLSPTEAESLGLQFFFELPRENTESLDPDFSIWVLIGFPARHQEFEPREKAFVMQARTTRLGRAEERAYEHTGLHRTTHLLLGYREQLIEEAGRRGAPAHLRGTSGGGVWRMDFDRHSQELIGRPVFEGIFTERPHSFRPALMVTRPFVINAFLDMNGL
jgi:hypothetical protein